MRVPIALKGQPHTRMVFAFNLLCLSVSGRYSLIQAELIRFIAFSHLNTLRLERDGRILSCTLLNEEEEGVRES